MLDLHIFKKTEPGGASEYCMYLISANGVLVYYSIEKKEDSKPVFDEPNLVIHPNCADCDYGRGLLLIDAA